MRRRRWRLRARGDRTAWQWAVRFAWIMAGAALVAVLVGR